MTEKAVKKIKDLNQKIEELAAQKVALEKELAENFVSTLSSMGALALDPKALMGGLIYVVNQIKTGAPAVKEWQSQGGRFRNKKRA